ncbi:HNH endonuclease [Reichenbachiella versicolor]|uniref:HNH endonuclease n=1 Tax=Reichenbachiella versicolor TaxID=1821036 RepID=UPI000D6DC7EB|nr:HNH endonuclease [Reichenbachiella versicolor]
MNWVQIDKKSRVQKDGVYTDWKQQVSDDCQNRCVYCSIHENPWGGIDHYHIEHFRPKSKFKKLENDITNLYHACPVCNRFKSDDWPNNPINLDEICYPDPSDHNYTDLFELDQNDFTLVGKHVASRYVVNRLYLNRPQLVYERREQVLKIRAEELIAETTSLINKTEDLTLSRKVSMLLIEMYQHLNVRSNIAPYRLIEIRKK